MTNPNELQVSLITVPSLVIENFLIISIGAYFDLPYSLGAFI